MIEGSKSPNDIMELQRQLLVSTIQEMKEHETRRQRDYDLAADKRVIAKKHSDERKAEETKVQRLLHDLEVHHNLQMHCVVR